MRRLDRSSRRLIVAHMLAAIGMSLPWPLLLALVWGQTQSDLALGLAGAARMAPYVVLSWLAGRWADSGRRDRVIRLTLWTRLVLLVAAAAIVVMGRPLLAVGAAALAVAAGTPAFPAAAAAMPTTAREQRVRATELLVTVEVGSFVVGPAIGGLLLSEALQPVALLLPVAATAAAIAVLAPVRLGAPAPRVEEATGAVGVLRSTPAVQQAFLVICGINFGLAFLGVALVTVASTWWGQGAWAFGLATGALGFGAFAAPLLDLLGLGVDRRIRWGVLAMGCLVATLGVLPTVAWSVLPLFVVGALACHVESAATAVLQEHVVDHMRASILGLTDTAMVAAAMVGAAVAPAIVTRAPATGVLIGLGVALAAVLWLSVRVGRQSPAGAEADQGGQRVGLGLGGCEGAGGVGATGQLRVHSNQHVLSGQIPNQRAGSDHGADSGV